MSFFTRPTRVISLLGLVFVLAFVGLVVEPSDGSYGLDDDGFDTVALTAREQIQLVANAGGHESVVRIALSRVGKPYRYGATGPNAFDCSGLMVWSYKQVGISLPRTSRAQSQFGAPVSRDNLQPGDLVFFYRPVSHVAMYIGNGRIVHASQSGKPVRVSTLTGRQYNTARRP